MTLELSQERRAVKRSLEDLFDKGLENMPENWELAEVAAWEAHMQLRDQEMAIKYARIGSEMPGAPHRLKRVYGRWSEKRGTWTISDSIKYWEEALAEAVNWPDIVLSKNHLYDAYAKLDSQSLDPLLTAYIERFGQCASSWQELIDLGWIRAQPLDYVGNPYRIDELRCVLQPHKKIRWDR